MSGVWFVICIPTESEEFKNTNKTDDSISEKYTKCDVSKESVRKRNSSGSKVSSCGTFSTAHSVLDGESRMFNIEDQKITQEAIFENLCTGSLQSSSKGGRETKSESDLLVDFVENGASLRKLLEETLINLKVTDTFWNVSLDQTLYQVSFLCESGSRSDAILRYLTSQGIGLVKGSTIGVIPCAMFYRETNIDENDDECSLANADQTNECDDTVLLKKKESTGIKALQRDFIKSITSRLTVAQVVEGVRANASLTFDFAALIIFASIIAAIGLVENNSIILVASMLISPLMGPILAGTFGAVVQDRSLWLLGTRTEIIGLTMCIILGFLIGLIYTGLHWSPELWPTVEMSSRGQLKNLVSGAFIALPSGGGVALSILGGNVGSLVGVAISASLLPPAVNAGLLWGMAAVLSQYTFKNPSAEMVDVNSTTLTENYHTSSPSYNFVYSDNISKEFAVLGVVSLLLTIINILCIFCSAVFVLKIKEVAPNTNVPKTRRFWKRDIQIARDYNKTFRRGEARTFGKQVMEEWTKINGIQKKNYSSPQEKRIEFHRFRSVVESLEADKVYQTVMKSVPGGHLTEPLCRYLLTWPDHEVSRHPSLWDVHFPDFIENNDGIFRQGDITRAKKYPHDKNIGFSFESVSNFEPIDSVSDTDFYCRHPHNSSNISTSGASSYNNFLPVNRMGYWTPFGLSRNKSNRFEVTPVDEQDTPSSQTRPKHVNLPSSALDTITTV